MLMNIVLQQALETDSNYLKKLFIEFKSEELFGMATSDPLMTQMLEMQYIAQQQFYQSQYPGATSYIIVEHHTAVGRLLLDKTHNYHVVDIIVAKMYRGKGIAARVINGLKDEALLNDKKVCLLVARNNPAQNLYLKLGFQIIEQSEMYLKMIC